MSCVQPARSCSGRGRAVSMMARAWSGPTDGRVGGIAQPESHAINATGNAKRRRDRSSRLLVTPQPYVLWQPTDRPVLGQFVRAAANTRRWCLALACQFVIARDAAVRCEL